MAKTKFPKKLYVTLDTETDKENVFPLAFEELENTTEIGVKETVGVYVLKKIIGVKGVVKKCSR